QINCHALIQKSWAHVKEKRLLPARSPVTGFFDQLTLSGGKMVLTRINASCGQLPQALAGGISKLALQQDQRRASRIVERQDDDRSRMPDHVSPHAYVSGFFHFIRHYTENRSTESG